MKNGIINKLCLKFRKKSKQPEEVKEQIVPNSERIKIKDVRVYDDVFIRVCGDLRHAWVTGIDNETLSVCYGNMEEADFCIKGHELLSTVVEGNKILILNKEDI